MVKNFGGMMNPVFEMKEREEIEALLDRAEYGTLALCDREGVPYAVPLNFVRVGEAICFHGAKRGRKMAILSSNPRASFSVVEALSLIDSDFSSAEGLACPTTQFYRSVHIEGVIETVVERREKAAILQLLMEKLQPKGGYLPLEHPAYDKALAATAIFLLRPQMIRAKAKAGQHLPADRYDRIVSHLKQRDTPLDRKTLELMERYRRKRGSRITEKGTV